MSRLLLLVLLPAVLCAAAWSAYPPGKVAAPGADTPQPRPPVQALCKVVDYPGLDDPTTTLAEGLDRLTKLSGVTFHIHDRAFKYDQISDVHKCELVVSGPIPAVRAPLAQVLRLLLERLPAPTGATYLVRDGHVEITTGRYQSAEVPLEREQSSAKAVDPRIPGPPAGGVEEESKKILVAVVSVVLERQPLEEAVRQIRNQADVSLVLDPALGEKATTPLTVTLLNAPLDSALLVLGELADADCVWLDNIFFVTTKDKADKLRAKWLNRRGGATRPLTPPGATRAL
jgi:hypothetical protein